MRIKVEVKGWHRSMEAVKGVCRVGGPPSGRDWMSASILKRNRDALKGLKVNYIGGTSRSLSPCNEWSQKLLLRREAAHYKVVDDSRRHMRQLYFLEELLHPLIFYYKKSFNPWSIIGRRNISKSPSFKLMHPTMVSVDTCTWSRMD